MVNFLHTFQPRPIIFSLGPVAVHWYGLCIVLGILAALAVAFALSKHYQISRDTIFDLAFWLVIGGLIGSRLYDVLLQLPYYLQHPLQIIQIWKGGLAIHGAIIAGLLIIWYFARRHKLGFWKLTALIAPGLALGQAIGRWGNYFNQELFGLPTVLPWGIPIDIFNRPLTYTDAQFFHPTFLYESLGNFLIFIILISLNIYFYRRQKPRENKEVALKTSAGTTVETTVSKIAAANHYFYVWIVALYMILYSILRFALEFIRLDAAPYLLGLRWPQIISLIIIIFSILILIFHAHARRVKTNQ